MFVVPALAGRPHECGTTNEDNLSTLSSPFATNIPPPSVSNESLRRTFPVDTLNIKGPLSVRIMAKTRTRKKEVAKVELSIFNLLDCLLDSCVGKDRYYVKWFPMFHKVDCIAAEYEEMSGFMRHEKSEQSYFHYLGQYQPCIQIRFRWISGEDSTNFTSSSSSPLPQPLPLPLPLPHSFTQQNQDQPKFYTRIQLPSISIAIVDSVKAREVLQISFLFYFVAIISNRKRSISVKCQFIVYLFSFI